MVVDSMASGRFDVVRKVDGFDYPKKKYDYCGGRDDGVRLDQSNCGNGYKRIPIKGDRHRRGRLDGVVLNAGRSDDAVGPVVGIGKVENGEQLRREKKRKFSPVIWDREEGTQVRISSKKKIVTTKFPSQVPKDADVGVYPITTNQPQGSRSSSAESCVSQGSVESALSESRDNLSPLVFQENYGNKEQELDAMGDEAFGQGYSISRSRWACDHDSFDDLHLSGDMVMPERQVTAHDHEFSSPECGEFLIEGSVGNRGRLSGSEEGSCLSGPAHGDKCPEYGSDSTAAMEIEGACDDGVAIGQFGYVSYDDDVQDPTVSMHGRVDMLQSCRSVFEYERLNKINEGAYGIVYRARDKETGEIMALKKVKMGREAEREGFPLTALREINILLSFDHPSVVGVKEVVTDESDGIFMVMEYMEHDLKGLMEKMKQPFSTSEVKCLMKQLLEGVKYLHENWVIHRDLKTSNILLNNKGEMKICDFGLSRQYGSPLKPYTSLVVTLWYRAPELLLGQKQYSTAIDMWSVGCIMAELLAKKPLFQGETEIDQLGKIFKILGSPNEEIWPGFNGLPGSKGNFVKQPYNLLRKIFPVSSFTGSQVLSDSGFDLLNKLLTFDPAKRITAEDALNHDWFREVPLPKSKDFMPTFPAQHCQDRHTENVLVKMIVPLLKLIYWMLHLQQCE